MSNYKLEASKVLKYTRVVLMITIYFLTEIPEEDRGEAFSKNLLIKNNPNPPSFISILIHQS